MKRNRRTFYEEKETKKIFTVSLSVLIIAVLTFVIAYVVYSNAISDELNVAEAKKNSITDLSKINKEEISEASTSIGKTINEVESEKTNEIEVEKIAINTSNMIKENIIDENNVQETANVEETKKEEKVLYPTFVMPLEGEITVNYAKENLVYSNTLQEWVTHLGIDIKAPKTTVVKASDEGTIKSIKNDPRYGITVVIEHTNGFESLYANLLTAEFVKEGEKVKQGQSIGTVGNTGAFEIVDEPHLHFEILKDGENLDPSIFLR